MAIDEDLDLMYSQNPRISPSRTPDDFNIELIQLHIARIGSLIEGKLSIKITLV